MKVGFATWFFGGLLLLVVSLARAERTPGGEMDVGPQHRSLSGDYDYGPLYPSVVTTSLPPPGQTAGEKVYPANFWCRDVFSGQIVPFSDMVVALKVQPGSGGHYHDTGDPDRPKGDFDRYFFNTGALGIATLQYTAPEASGVMIVETACPEPGYESWILTETFTIGVEWPGLQSLEASSPYYTLYYGRNPANRTRHPDSHWGNPTMNAKLMELARLYAAEFRSAPPLAFNDISLEGGGMFDVDPDWLLDVPKEEMAHVSHRWGLDADIAKDAEGAEVPLENRAWLESTIEHTLHLSITHQDSHHWHVRLK